ncbi:MAG: helicase-exonuclease AddAB subunit AddB, partial [Eubacterium sp.]|nr:helicase-exonuclease AddAB subunit AddB [Eubacterium sp.]
MSLAFIAGSSGAGKSYQIYREIIEESMREPEQQFLVIVPEQFTMQTQKEIVQMHPRKGMLNLDVLSFNRLAWRVFEKVGGSALPVLDDLGKSLITQRVIGSEQKKLKVLGRTLSRQGAAEE